MYRDLGIYRNYLYYNPLSEFQWCYRTLKLYLLVVHRLYYTWCVSPHSDMGIRFYKDV